MHLIEQETMSLGSKGKTKDVTMANLVSSMKEQLDYYWSLGEATDKGMNHSPICKVQQHIREVDRFSFEPFILSIGPYHHGAAKLRNMDKLKWGYLDEVIRLNPEKTLPDFLVTIGELIQEARNCYPEEIGMDDEEFLQMLLLDGCFILVGLGGTQRIFEHVLQTKSQTCALEEVVVENENGLGKQLSRDTGNDIQSSASNTADQDVQTDRKEANEDGKNDDQAGLWFGRFINHDLFLLENQIPFFIVKKLYELAAGQTNLASGLTDDMKKYVELALCFYPKAVQASDRLENFQHLLHLCHMYFRPNMKVDNSHYYTVEPIAISKLFSFGRKYFKLGHHPEANEQVMPAGQEVDSLRSGQELNRWRRVAQYIEAGVKFKKHQYDNLDPHSLLDIKFMNGSIEIPCLVVDEYTGSLFRNLIAFEQTCPQFGDDFTAYIVFMSQIISMPEDVTLLVDREIIVHHLDSDKHVSDLFTMLSKDVVFDFNGNYYLRALCLAMEAHYQSRLNRWIAAWLWVNHFSNPWLALAALGTVLVLICTIIQTIYTVLTYIKPLNHK